MSLVKTRLSSHDRGGLMAQYIPRFSASLALSLALFAGACSKKDDTAAADSALNKDIQLANRDTSAQPALTDVPAGTAANPAPSTTTKTTTTTRSTTRTPTTTTKKPTTSVTSSGNTVTRNSAGTGAKVGTIPAGATLNLASGSKVCTNTNHVGDRFSASVTNAVTGSNGAVIPAGATATVEVTDLKRSENANDNVVMGFRVVSVNFRGHSTKATVIGGAVGAAAGAGAAAATANYEGCVNSGSRITATLNSSTQVNI